MFERACFENGSCRKYRYLCEIKKGVRKINTQVLPWISIIPALYLLDIRSLPKWSLPLLLISSLVPKFSSHWSHCSVADFSIPYKPSCLCFPQSLSLSYTLVGCPGLCNCVSSPSCSTSTKIIKTLYVLTVKLNTGNEGRVYWLWV